MVLRTRKQSLGVTLLLHLSVHGALVFKMKHKALNGVVAAGLFLVWVAPLDMGRFVKKPKRNAFNGRPVPVDPSEV